MDDEPISWIRRTRFPHSVCHHIDPSRLDSLSLAIGEVSSSRKFRQDSVQVNLKTEQTDVQIRKNSSTNRQRAASPQPEIKLSNAFKEAQSNQKRFSTPNSRKKLNKVISGELLSKDSKEINAASRNASTFKELNSVKFSGKPKNQKSLSWMKCFDHGGGRVTSVEAQDEHMYMVDLSKLYLGPRFAHGAHSQLYQGVYMDDPVAVKIIRIPDDDENGSLGVRLEKQFTREVTLLSRLHHQNVIKFVGACRKPPVFCIVTEYLSEGSLRTHFHKHKHESFPIKTVISMALDIARGMEYIHSQGVIHSDLKPENILLTGEFRLKVADFGIACEEAFCDLMADDRGTYRWMAPEMIKRKQYGRKVDVYGFGLILWEFVAGTIPYEDMSPVQAAFAVDLRPVVPTDCPLPMKALIEQCWSFQPDKRPEFWQIVEVLEEFESSLLCDGILTLPQNITCHDHKKRMLRWIQKLGSI
ncbi:serine/threonine/tyrosine-protein kinase HT1-like isoform X2 [Andrographis paniculata]|uniref:serine/threonine/tyrosine-protein kinase HT1-like isoform X2 n=1 Tax=Andrographis paniculata TaxID=175694 RepID=UPI0021E71A00|nr:serine/threonine/tyrosine-protein kinase HT1-like isoform X2 [Andrographis paniculata]